MLARFDKTKIVVGGSGAGGHIAAMLCARAPSLAIRIMGSVLFYPNLDPGDSSRHALRCGSFSIVRTMFENCILGGKDIKEGDVDSSADFVGNLSEMENVLRSWPPVFLVHGSNDSLSPVETSRLFVEKLNEARGERSGIRACDFYLEIPGARHSFDIPGSDDSKFLFGGAADWCKKQVDRDPFPEEWFFQEADETVPVTRELQPQPKSLMQQAKNYFKKSNSPSGTSSSTPASSHYFAGGYDRPQSKSPGRSSPAVKST